MIAFRFEHIEISGSAKTGLQVYSNADVTLGPSAVVRNNSGSGVYVFSPKGAGMAVVRWGRLTLDGGIVENNSGGGILVRGALFTMKRGSIRNNTAGLDKYGENSGGGIYIDGIATISIEGGDITGNTASQGGGVFIASGSAMMSGGSVSGNTATAGTGGVFVGRHATFSQWGGTVSGNRAPSSTPADTHDIWRE
jgi:hypothetical protein